MKNKLAIIVPVYKVEQYIHQCIDSILNQSYKDFTLILVDDGSPDNCPEICEEYKKRDSRIIVVHKKNGGLTSAWIEGFKYVPESCDYVTFVDSDDWISSGYLADFMKVVEEYEPDVIIGNTNKFYKDNNRFVPSIYSGFFDRCKLENELFPSILFDGRFHGRSYPVSRWGKMYKKCLLSDNIKYCNSKTSYAEDLNITFPVMLDSDSVFFLENDKGIYQYRLNPNSMLHAYDRTMLNSINHVYPTLIQVCEDKGQNRLINQVVADYLAASVQYFKNELQNPKGVVETRRAISRFSHNELLQQAIKEVEWKKFRKLNVIIIKSLRNYNWFNKYIVTTVLRILKISGIKKPS